MKKTIFALCSGVLLLFAFSACGKNASPAIDCAKTAGQLSSSVKFDETLTLQDKDTVLALFQLTDAQVAEVTSYTGSGATVDECSVWKAKNQESALEVEAKIKAYLENQKEDYRSYKPSEMPKLSSAVLTVYKNYVFFCVTADTANANQIINQAIQA